MSYPVHASVEVTSPSGSRHALPDYHKLTLSQHVLTHHSFALELSCEALGKALGLKPEMVPNQAHTQLCGGDITISWKGALPDSGGRSFEFKGIVTHVSVQTDADLVNYYHLSGYSPTFLLEDGTRSRTFVKKTVQSIFSEVLQAYEHNTLKKELKAQGQQVLPYVVQYNESTFHFLSRLAAQHNEWFYYDGTTLRLGPGPDHVIPFRASSAQVFSLAMHLQPGKTEAAAYNYRTHASLKSTAAAPSAGHAFGRYALQQSDRLFTQPARLPAGGTMLDKGQLQRTLDGLAAKRAVNQVSLEGRGEAFELGPGSVLDVQDAAGTAYGKFRVLAVRHEVDGEGNYTNHFEAMPAAGSPAPPNPMYPATDAQPELAEVIDLADPRHLGRVRVRFGWAVAQAGEAESGWLRVSTPYSGDGKGQLFTPEKGSQVLVGYEHGQADLPVVLGNLFHAQNPQKAKYSTEANHLKGLQTAGGNKVVMSDKKGEQTILLSNANNKGTAVEVGFKGDGSITIKSNGPISILAGGNIALTAKKDIVMTAENVTINAKKKISKTAKEIELTGSDKLDMTGKATSIKAGDTMKIAASSSLEVNGGSKASISSGKTRIH